jgi:hypothetical protein
MPLRPGRRAWYRSGVRYFVSLFGRCLPLGLALGLAIGAAAPLASADPPTTHEVIYARPSGFWTSNRPAVGGAYRWRLLGLGVVIAAVTGYAMLRLVRRANAERATRR